MSLLSALNINATGMKAQRQRVEVATTNLANSQTTRTSDGGPYRRQEVVFQSMTFDQSLEAARSGFRPQGVEVVKVVEDPSGFHINYEPGHPDADADGNVAYPNVNSMQEMANLASAARSYQANVSAISVLKTMIQRTLDLAR